MPNYTTPLDSLLAIEQFTRATLEWSDPKQFLADGAGTESTIVSALLGAHATADDDFVLQWVICIDATNTENHNQVRRITSYDHATTTLTIDRLPAATAVGDVFLLMTGPNPYISEDTGGAAIDFRDTECEGGDDEWNTSTPEGGPYLEVIESVLVAKTALLTITDFTDLLGIAEATLGANNTLGDAVEIWSCPAAMGRFDLTIPEVLQEEAAIGTFDPMVHIPGRRSASGALEFKVRGPGSGRSGDQSELHRFLAGVLSAGGLSTDLTINGLGATNSWPYDAGTAVVGQMYVSEEGAVAMCTAAGSPAIVTPAAVTIPGDDTIATHLQTYGPADAIVKYMAFKQYEGDGYFSYLFGGVPNIEFSGELGQMMKATLNYQFLDALPLHEDSAGNYTRAWRAKKPTQNAVMAGHGRCVLGSTSLKLKQFSINMNLEYVLEEDVSAPNHVCGWRLVGRKPTCQLVARLDTDNKEHTDEVQSGRLLSPLLIQSGTSPGSPGVFAFWMYQAQCTSAKISDDGGKKILTADFEAKVHTSDSIPSWAVAIG